MRAATSVLVGSFRTTLHVLGTAVVSCFVVDATAQSRCVYIDERGHMVAQATLRDVPPRFRAQAACEDKQPQYIPNAADVSLRGGERSESFVTDIGRMDVRWPRQIERCFTKNPSRAIAEAASAANRALKSGRFGASLKYGKKDWSLVFIDRASAVSQFPMALSLGGHPGFMVPPNQIYIVTDYISPNCAPEGDVDSKLIQVLLHEMGHVLEYTLLGSSNVSPDRKRAEGFAAWFEGYSSKYASGISQGAVKNFYRGMVRDQSRVGGSSFSGSGEDYAIASLEFEAVVARKGVAGLMDVYATMSADNCSFYEALSKKFGWDKRALAREVKNLNPS